MLVDLLISKKQVIMDFNGLNRCFDPITSPKAKVSS